MDVDGEIWHVYHKKAAGRRLTEMQPTCSPKLSVVIVNYDSWPDVLRLVDTLTKAEDFTKGLFEIIVVDNCSPVGIPASRPHRDNLFWVDQPTNGGFASGVNAGWRQARGQWLLLLNPDISLNATIPGQLLTLLDRVQTGQMPPDFSGHTGIVGLGLVNPDGSRQPSVGAFPTLSRGLLELFLPRNRRRYQIVSPEKISAVDWVTGAAFLVNTQTMTDLNGFDEAYFLYFEETDFCLRARLAGWATLYEPAINLCHEKPLQNRAVSPMIRLLTRHSRLLYFRKNRPAFEFMAMRWIVWSEAIFKNWLCRMGIGTYKPEVWAAVARLTTLFRSGKYPVGEATREWAEASLNITEKSPG